MLHFVFGHLDSSHLIHLVPNMFVIVSLCRLAFIEFVSSLVGESRREKSTAAGESKPMMNNTGSYIIYPLEPQ